ncbi:MAG TPA: hypothetical protein VIK91_18630 [Nannocystis sp.]
MLAVLIGASSPQALGAAMTIDSAIQLCSFIGAVSTIEPPS